MNVAAYLSRIGRPDLLNVPPSADHLRELHVAHIEQVSYEALEIWLGRPTTVDPLESAARIIGGRGGYCFHLNGAFSLLATALGYEVTRHVGGAQQDAAAGPRVTGNHLVLTVRLPDGDWLVDLGLGDGLHEPLPLVAGTYRQGPFEYVLRPSEIAPGGWRFDHDPRGSFVGMDFDPAPVEMSAFAAKHHELTTSPDSGFVRVAVAQRRDAGGVDTLRGLVLTRVGDRSLRTTITTQADYFAALADVFGLPMADVGPRDREKLWRRLQDAQERWLSGNGSPAPAASP
ncbi:arylamine N-acetyltransferase [Nonomuraea sp. NPDC050790]|uniref:arylamine N-acetyltransferase n=1 Tax=Nonomuraea sp. NPDC050790 TaxID=3364371 RepID=UPI0037B1E73C